jgi:hypothetical protein
VVRKLGVPFQPELGMGAIGEDGVRIINDEVRDLFWDEPGRHLPLSPSQSLSHDCSHTA